MSPRVQVLARPICGFDALQQVAQPAKHGGVGLENIVDLRLGKRANFVRHHDRRAVAVVDPALQRHVQTDQFHHAVGNGRLPDGLVDQLFVNRYRPHETRDGQVFLAPEIIGDAVLDQSHAGTHIGQRGADNAFLIEEPRRG